MTVETDVNCPWHGQMVKIVAGRNVPRGAVGLLAWAKVAHPFNESEAEKWAAKNDELIAQGKIPTYGWRIGLDIGDERVWTFLHNVEPV